MLSNDVFNACPREAIQEFSCVSESYVLSNSREKMDIHAGKVVRLFGVFDLSPLNQLPCYSWMAFPISSYLPSPDPELFKEYSVTGHGGFTCAQLLIRTPVLVHMSSSQTSFKVIVAGSSTASDEHLSREVEVFDSEWTEACDVPRPVFALNEHQGGLCVNGTVLFITFLESGDKGVVAFDLKTREWVQDRTCAILDSCSCNTLQLVEIGGKVYLVSKKERRASAELPIDKLEFLTDTTWRWKNVIRMKRSDARSLLVYPEQTCVGFRDGKLCSFNDRNGDGVVYDTRIGELLVKTSGHGDSRAADFTLKQVLFKFVRVLKGTGAMGIFQKTLLAMAVGCLPQRANAQQVTGNSNPVDVAAWLTSDIAKGALVTALFAGGLGAAFIWKRFFCSPPAFSVDAGLEASSDELGRRRIDLDSFYPRIEC